MKLSRVPVVFAALPLAVVGLSGAASVPEPQMFVGAMTDVVSVTGAGCEELAGSIASGRWSARFDGSGVVVVHMTIKLDGRMHRMWSMPFTGALTESGFLAAKSVQWPNGDTDELEVSLDGDEFTFTLDSVFLECNAEFAGTLGR